MDQELLKEILLNWDGKHTDFLTELYDAHGQQPGFIDDTVEIYAADPTFEHATTWILKHHVDRGNTLKPAQTETMLQKLGALDYWESQLHVLQIIPRISLSQQQAESIEPHVRRLLQSEKKFVKAAAYEAYFEAVKLLPQLNQAFRTTCEEALSRESASVKVKIRRIWNALQASTGQE